MLAQNFKTADELGISEPQRDALIKTLVLLETGKLKHLFDHEYDEDQEQVLGDYVDEYGGGPFTGHFNMGEWRVGYECGTVACIGGTAEIVGKVDFNTDKIPDDLRALFYGQQCPIDLDEITTEQAARALRSYLTTGWPSWDVVCQT